MNIRFEIASSNSIGYVYLAEYELFKWHVNHGVSEEDYGDSANNIGTFMNDIKMYYDKHKAKSVVCIVDDVPRGFVGYRKDGNAIYIVSLYVDKDFRNKGLARKLVERVHKLTNCTKMKSLISDQNTESKRFFTKLGFEKQGESNIHSMSEYVLNLK